MKFGERLRDRRLIAGLSQSELARRCGVTPQWIQQLESFDGCPSVHVLRKLTEMLDCQFSDLLVHGDDEEEEESANGE